MSTATSLTLTPTARKRSHDGEVVTHPIVLFPNLSADTPRLNLPSPNHDPLPSSVQTNSRQASPALSADSSVLTDLTPSVAASPGAQTSTPSNAPAKRRKLTFAEREVEKAMKRQEREAREKAKAEEKSRKEEEKALKDDERRKKEEQKEAARKGKELEKAEKQKLKDAKKQAKHAEKAKKEEEESKKARSQLKLGAYFARPVPASTPPSTPDDVSVEVSSRRSSIASIADIEMPDVPVKLSPRQNLEFSRLFPPFFVHEHTEVAPYNRFISGNGASTLMGYRIETILSQALAAFGKDAASELTALFKRHSPLGMKSLPHQRPVREILEQMNGNSQTPIDLTYDNLFEDPSTLLAHIPYKILSFTEDVRPPYQGTFTRKMLPSVAMKLSRRPFSRALPEANYDYDSEAEWEEPAEGDEDINGEDEKSESGDEEDDMEEFLDDEGDFGKRRMILGDVEPVCSGLCWDGEASTEQNKVSMKEYAMEIITDESSFPIDPYSTDYWIKLPPKEAAVPAQPAAATANIMQPPRLPLSTISSTNSVIKTSVAPTSTVLGLSKGSENTAPGAKQRGPAPNPNKPVKLISADLLPAFKQAISGSDLTKAGLIEILKKQFPKVPKDVIKDTLSTVAAREGTKEADKRWVLL